ncbi:site-specific integrase [Aurantimonas aggregata]|uniref:Site-specific integrase n=1 Tax=Aurantimonas aggregata TaxID=2047720 RepID=A0A6L9MNK3_9HYPH|nr:site-specific integrase [Aurantimonas aggregata]
MLKENSSFDWRQAFARLEGAYAPSSIRAYFSDVEAFVQWCHQREHQPFPADPLIICAFLYAQSASLAVSTVKRRLYAIRRIHRLLKLDTRKNPPLSVVFAAGIIRRRESGAVLGAIQGFA